MTARILFYLATLLQVLAVLYAFYLLRKRGGLAAWLWLIGSMLSMLTWRLVMMFDVAPPPFFNPLIAIWGSTCLVFGMFFFGREIARRERAEAQRDLLLDSERSAREQAERANRLKDQFLGMLPHELSTPLTAIIGWCDVLRSLGSRARPQDTREALDTIERNARAQAKLIEDLLDLTRIEAGTFRLELRPLAAALDIRSAIDTIRPAAQAKNIHLDVSLDESIHIFGDPMRLQQIAWNLLSNAVKFTPASGCIAVALNRDDSCARLVVSDTGEGIAPDFIPHVFTRFRQFDGTISRRHGGLGMGLSIVKSLVEHHQGTVEAQSEGPGRGARFTIHLPLALDGSANPAPCSASDSSRAPSLQEISVLDVEDEPDLRAIIRRVLETEGAAVYAAESAAEALAALLAVRPDVIVSDIGMPGEDGYSFIRRVRAMAPPLATIPALALTAYARDQDRGHALQSGFQLHLPRPLDPNQLVREVAELLRSGRASAPVSASY